MQVEIVTEVLHLQPHQLCPLKEGAVEPLTGVAQPRPEIHLHRAAAAKVVLAVHADMLRNAENIVISKQNLRDLSRLNLIYRSCGVKLASAGLAQVFGWCWKGAGARVCVGLVP